MKVLMRSRPKNSISTRILKLCCRREMVSTSLLSRVRSHYLVCGLVLTRIGYVLNFALPNFYFHFVTAYDILRAQGVQIGKNNYLGRE